MLKFLVKVLEAKTVQASYPVLRQLLLNFILILQYCDYFLFSVEICVFLLNR